MLDPPTQLFEQQNTIQRRTLNSMLQLLALFQVTVNLIRELDMLRQRVSVQRNQLLFDESDPIALLILNSFHIHYSNKYS